MISKFEIMYYISIIENQNLKIININFDFRDIFIKKSIKK